MTPVSPISAPSIRIRRPNPARRLADLGVSSLALATVIDLVVERVHPGFSVHRQFMDSTGSNPLDTALALGFALCVLGSGPLRRTTPRLALGLAVAFGTAVALSATRSLVRHAIAVADGSVRAAGAFPPLTLVALALIVPWIVGALRPPVAAVPRRSLQRTASIALACAAWIPITIFAYGATDYRTPAGAVLVLGAKVHADGRPSAALVDRTRTACAHYRDGLATHLVLSGGRDAGSATSEPEAMARIAQAEGVPDSALILDETGVNTEASIRFAAGLVTSGRFDRFLVVSHDYHLARLRLLANRAGLDVRTVPANETCAARWKVLATGREVVALAAAWLGL